MVEIIILYKVMIDITHNLQTAAFSKTKETHRQFIFLSKAWTGGLLTLAILISIPPVNTLIHGTHAVTAHAMGSEIGIDSFILFAVMAYLLNQWVSHNPLIHERLNGRCFRRIVSTMNFTFFCLFSWLLFSGISVGVSSFLGMERPKWVAYTPFLFAFLGSALALQIVYILGTWASVMYTSRSYFFAKDQKSECKDFVQVKEQV
jgi:hypothetical protein